MRRKLLIGGLMIVVALGVRWFHLGERVAWFDEAVSLLVARAPSPGAAFVAARDEGHAPLFNLVLHYWSLLAPGESGARWLSVWLGVATVAVVFGIGQRIAGGGCHPAASPACGTRGDRAPLRQLLAGAVSAGLLALCPLHVWYSQEIRMYALQVCLVSLSYLFLLMALEKRGNSWWVGYVIVTALSLYAQYTSFLALAAQNLYILLTWRRHRVSLKAWGVAQGAVAVLFAPWLTQLIGHLQQKAQGGFWIQPLTWDMPVKFFSLLTGSYLTDERGRWLVVGMTWVLLAGALIVVWRDRTKRDRALLLTLWLFLPVVLLLIVSLRQNLFLPRVILFVAPAFALLLGCAVAQRAVAWAGVVVLVCLNAHALAGYHFHENVWVKSPMRTASKEIAREFSLGDVVIHSSQFSYRPFQFYAGPLVRQGVIAEMENQPGLFGIIGDGRVSADAAQSRRIWLVLYPDFLQPGLHQGVLEWMNIHHRLLRVVHESRMLYIGLYERGDAPVMPPSPKLDCRATRT